MHSLSCEHRRRLVFQLKDRASGSAVQYSGERAAFLHAFVRNAEGIFEGLHRAGVSLRREEGVGILGVEFLVAGAGSTGASRVLTGIAFFVVLAGIRLLFALSGGVGGKNSRGGNRGGASFQEFAPGVEVFGGVVGHVSFPFRAEDEIMFRGLARRGTIRSVRLRARHCRFRKRWIQIEINNPCRMTTQRNIGRRIIGRTGFTRQGWQEACCSGTTNDYPDCARLRAFGGSVGAFTSSRSASRTSKDIQAVRQYSQFSLSQSWSDIRQRNTQKCHQRTRRSGSTLWQSMQ
jgi:hypothetical protein